MKHNFGDKDHIESTIIQSMKISIYIMRLKIMQKLVQIDNFMQNIPIH